MNVGDKLKLFREHKGKSLEEIADMLKMPLRTYTDIENNKRQPKYDKLVKASEYLGVPLEAFLSDTIFVTINNNNSTNENITHTNSGNGQYNNNNMSSSERELMKEMLQMLRMLADKMRKE